MSGPRITSGADSKQDYRTPPEFIAAVVRRFGPITFDLAADETNHVAPDWYGPGSPRGEDSLSLSADWNVVTRLSAGLMWLNPPWRDIRPWAAKAETGGRLAMLVLASVGSNWFADHVDGKALVLFCRPRLTFVGAKDPYTKDLMLAVYGEPPGYECWRWKL